MWWYMEVADHSPLHCIIRCSTIGAKKNIWTRTTNKKMIFYLFTLKRLYTWLQTLAKMCTAKYLKHWNISISYWQITWYQHNRNDKTICKKLSFRSTLIRFCVKFVLVVLTPHGPLARYIKLRVAHAPGMPGTFSPPPRVSDSIMHHGTCVTHVPWCITGSLTSDFQGNRWRGKRSRPSRRMRNPQFYVSGKRPIGKISPNTLRHVDG